MKKDTILTVVYVILGVAIAFGLYQGLSFLLSTDMPIVAVESNSMCPASNCIFARGDILIIQGVSSTELEVGDIIVFSIPGKFIVHRIAEKKDDGNFVTKGDRNSGPDPWTVTPSDIHGKKILVIPYMGWVKILITELVFPNLALIVIFGGIGSFIYLNVKKKKKWKNFKNFLGG